MSVITCTTQPYDAGRADLFSQIVGNQVVVRKLTRMVATNRIPKVVLLTGPTGSGKTTIARILARAILCMNRRDGEHEPCGICRNCEHPLNDTKCSVAEYSEYDANAITDQMLQDCALTFLHDWEVQFIDELQDLAPPLLKRLRKMVEGVTCTLILTTSHPDEIEDAFRNRLKSFEFAMTRPTPDEVADFLESQLKSHGVTYESRTQLIRVAEGLNCEMRPCGQFPMRVLSEAGVKLTDEYLNETFGLADSVSSQPVFRRKRVI